ncbi:MAG: right-handed parallel beta-helix repeat-containing protein [Solirubrobacteraceae bacterium]|jgi:hypothetical protein
MIGSLLGRTTRLLLATTAALVALAGVGAASASASTVCASCTFTTIQAAISNADTTTLPGQTAIIDVEPGTYYGPISVTGDVGIQIVGAGTADTTIVADPGSMSEFSEDGTNAYPIVLNDDSPGLSIGHVTIDGLDDGGSVGRPLAGIETYDSNLTVNDVDITSLADSPPDTAPTGQGIVDVNDSGPAVNELEVENSSISDYQQDAIDVAGNSDLALNIANDTLSGDGGPTNADGILVRDLPGGAPGPSGTITADTVTGNTSTTTETIFDDDSVNGAGIRLEDVSALTVSGNYLAGNDVGIWSSAATGATVTVKANTVENSTQADVLAGYGTNVISQNTIGTTSGAPETPIGVLVIGYKDDPTGALADAAVSANTISGTNSAVDVAVGNTAGAAPPSATITNNALFGNINGVENATTAAVDAVDNWWGCNSGPGGNGCSEIDYPNGNSDGAVTSRPYLVFAVSATPGSIAPGSSATVIASIRQDSGGTSFTSGPFPNGLPVSLATTAGSLAGTASLENGEAALVLTGTPLGTTTVSGTLDNQTATTSLTTANSVSTASSTAPGTVTVTVTVPATVDPLISFLGSSALSLFPSSPGSELSITCVDGCSASISGTIVLKEPVAKGKVKGKRRKVKAKVSTVKKTLTLTPAVLTLAADGSQAYAVTLSAAQRSALQQALSGTLTLNVSARDDSDGKTVTDSKTFVLSRT